MKKNIFIPFFIVIVSSAVAQTDTVINGKHYKMVEASKTDKHTTPLDSTFVIQNKKFRYYNNWLTAGAGWQQNLTYKRNLGFTGGVDYNFHIKQYYFQLGTNITGEKFGFYSNYQFHIGYGKRWEDSQLHAAVFAGLSYSSGRSKVDSIYIRPYSEPGIYIQAEVIKKLTYDVGAGASLFADWNTEQSIIGFRFIIYFSGAYRGKFNDQYLGE